VISPPEWRDGESFLQHRLAFPPSARVDTALSTTAASKAQTALTEKISRRTRWP